MKRPTPAQARWAAYALAGTLTLVAVVMVGGGDDGATDIVEAVPRAARADAARGAAPNGAGMQSGSPTALREADSPRSAGGTAPGRADGASVLLARRAREGAAPTADPFGVLGAEPTPEVSARRTAAPPPAPTAPPLPFTYLGRWKEQGRSFVYLQRDDHAYKIEGPGPIDGEYAVQSIDAVGITLRYLPLGQVQQLRFDAPPPAPAAVAAAPNAAATAAAPPDREEN